MLDQRTLVEQSLLSTHHPNVYPIRGRHLACVGEDEDDQLVFDLFVDHQEVGPGAA